MLYYLVQTRGPVSRLSVSVPARVSSQTVRLNRKKPSACVLFFIHHEPMKIAAADLMLMRFSNKDDRLDKDCQSLSDTVLVLDYRYSFLTRPS